jgi:osmoprotectant transport system ATP-binding protein
MTKGPAVITFEQVKKQNPDGTVAVNGLNLDVPDGKTMILVGPATAGRPPRCA